MPSSPIAHLQGRVDSSNALLVASGGTAVNWSEAPATTADAGQRIGPMMTEEGLPFVLGGHPNIVGVEFVGVTPWSNTAIIGSIPATHRVVVTMLVVRLITGSAGNSTVRIGFGTTVTPPAPGDLSFSAKMLYSAYAMIPGEVVVIGNGSGIIGVGLPDEEIRCDYNAGTVIINVHYFLAPA